MQRFMALLRRVRERLASDSASVPSTAGASEIRKKGRGGLHSAAASGDLARLQGIWWRKGFLINSRDAKKHYLVCVNWMHLISRTPLHLACANGHADVVRFLAGKKCKLNPRGMFKKTPLMLAVQHQHKDCVLALLEHGANPDHKGAGGNTALHLAAIMPSKSMVELLLEHNAHIDAQNDVSLGFGWDTLRLLLRSSSAVKRWLSSSFKRELTRTLAISVKGEVLSKACMGLLSVVQIGLMGAIGMSFEKEPGAAQKELLLCHL
ncbi:hypothetical protein Q9233_002929 [Columba guinea]|nr:hypothetical protein Q9233_002929 [Columba guinea]